MSQSSSWWFASAYNMGFGSKRPVGKTELWNSFSVFSVFFFFLSFVDVERLLECGFHMLDGVYLKTAWTSEEGICKQPWSICVFMCAAGSGTEYLGTSCCVCARKCQTGMASFECMRRLHCLTQSLCALTVIHIFFFALFFVHARAVQCVEQDLLSLSQWRVPNHGIACVQQYGRIGSFSFPVACIHVHNLLLSRLFPAASNARLQCSLSRLDGLAQIWAVPAFVVPVEPELCSNSCGLVVLVSLEHMQCHGCLLLRWVHVDTMCGPSLGSWCPVANRITTCWNMCPARAFPSLIWVSL